MEQAAVTLIDARKTKLIHRLAEQGPNLLMPCRRNHHAVSKTLGKFWRVIKHIFTRKFIEPWLVRRIVVVECEETIQSDHPVRICMETFQQITAFGFKAHFQYCTTFSTATEQVPACIQQ